MHGQKNGVVDQAVLIAQTTRSPSVLSPHQTRALFSAVSTEHRRIRTGSDGYAALVREPAVGWTLYSLDRSLKATALINLDKAKKDVQHQQPLHSY